MCMLSGMPGFAIVPMTMLLTVSFFVLLAARKADSQGVKAFGYVLAVLLWISAALVLSMGSGCFSGKRGRMIQKGQMPQGQMQGGPMQDKPMMHQGK